MRWFKNLKKWQKGGLIGCVVGLLLAIIVILSYRNSLGEWIEDIHAIFFMIMWTYGAGQHESSLAMAIEEYGGAATIVIFYGLLGILMGRAQRMVNAYWKWLLTALVALFLLLFYIMNVVTYII